MSEKASYTLELDPDGKLPFHAQGVSFEVKIYNSIVKLKKVFDYSLLNSILFDVPQEWYRDKFTQSNKFKKSIVSQKYLLLDGPDNEVIWIKLVQVENKLYFANVNQKFKIREAIIKTFFYLNRLFLIAHEEDLETKEASYKSC